MPSNSNKPRKDMEKTKPYKANNNKSKKRPVSKKTNQSQNSKVEGKKDIKGKKGKKQKKHPKLMMFLKICIILFLLLCVIGAGIIVGMFFGLFGDEFEITREELKIGASNSVVVDRNRGNNSTTKW